MHCCVLVVEGHGLKMEATDIAAPRIPDPGPPHPRRVYLDRAEKGWLKRTSCFPVLPGAPGADSPAAVEEFAPAVF